jgi:hypothetical protein
VRQSGAPPSDVLQRVSVRWRTAPAAHADASRVLEHERDQQDDQDDQQDRSNTDVHGIPPLVAGLTTPFFPEWADLTQELVAPGAALAAAPP